MIIFDILRVCAALMVFTIHLFIFVPDIPRGLADILSNGGYGVSVFFVISGFLIFKSLEGSKSLKEYYVKRISRILPAYYAILIVGMLVWDKMLSKMPEDTYLHMGWLRYFLCLNTWLPSDSYDFWNNIWGFWTISCFVFFYLTAPFIKKCINSFRGSAIFMVAMFLGTFVFSKAAEAVFVKIGAANPYMLAVDNPIYSLNTFSIGICAWYAYRENKVGKYLGLVSVILTGLVGLNMYNRMLWGLLTALIMMTFIDLEIKKEWLASFIRLLGRYSFSLYLVHLCVIEIIYSFNIRGALYLVLATICSVAAAVVLYNCVEKPVASFLKKRLL